jgi:hypothetical protein
MPLWLWPSEGLVTQSVQQALPLLGLGAQDIAVTWPDGFSHSAYAVYPSIEGGSLSIGLAIPGLKAGTRTASGCTIQVRNTGLVSIAAGAVLHVLAYG